MLLRAEITGTAAALFTVGFSSLVGVFGGIVIATRMRQTRAEAEAGRAGMVLLTAAISCAFITFLSAIEPLPWWIVGIAFAGLLWAALVEWRQWRAGRSS